MKITVAVPSYVYRIMTQCLKENESLDSIVQYCLGRSYFVRGDHFLEIFKTAAKGIDPKDTKTFEVEIDDVCQKICEEIAKGIVPPSITHSFEEKAQVIITISCKSFVDCIKQKTND